MKSILPLAVLMAGVLMAQGCAKEGGAPSASTQAPHFGEGGVPQFEYDRAWPKLPPQFTAGASVTAVNGTDDGHVWLMIRPGVYPKDTPAAAIPPPMMEFDADGNYIRGWGGQSGPGYQWPGNEHGFSIDSKGFFWIVGNVDSSNVRSGPKPPNDSQVLKFDKDGKFILALGKPGVVGSNKTEVLRGATTPVYYEKTNEVFVTDGYGNARVIVYDADTGAFKRMWGAYGRVPLDQADRPAPAKLEAEAGELAGGNQLVRLSERLQQFTSPVHDIKISNDGLVYVGDRGNKRVQVFTTEGKFLQEKFLGLDSPNPFFGRSIAFSPDPEQKFLYVGGTPGVDILNRRTLEHLGSAAVGEGDQVHPPGHNIGVDKAGNIYLMKTDRMGIDGKTPNSFGAYRLLFKGFSPAVACCVSQLTAAGAGPSMMVAFADPKTWTGDKLPAGQQCQKFKGKGTVPALNLAGVPAGATGIVLSVNDETYEGMNNGGHGVIRYAVTPTNGSVSLPSVPGETDDLPAGVTPVKKHIASDYSGTGGAILPPCSGGRGNTYSVTLTATDDAGATLAIGRAVLGKY